MKGISAVIATIMMLVITIALAGVAYMYISGIFTGQTARTVALDSSATFCNTTGIYLYVQDTGTQPFSKSNLNIGLAGGNLNTCNGTSLNDAALTPGGAPLMCDNVITGISAGFNSVVVTGKGLGPTNTIRGPVSC
jgi:flagellin-like protein